VWIETEPRWRYRNDKRFLLHRSNKQYACATLEDALQSYIARKKRQMHILRHQLLKTTRQKIFAEKFQKSPSLFEHLKDAVNGPFSSTQQGTYEDHHATHALETALYRYFDETPQNKERRLEIAKQLRKNRSLKKKNLTP
jgi:hypothetical protein